MNSFTMIPFPKQLKENLHVPPLSFLILSLALDGKNMKVKTYDDNKYKEIDRRFCH